MEEEIADHSQLKLLLKKSARKNKIVLDGGDLTVNWLKNNDVIMSGAVEKVFDGEFYVK